MPSFQAHGKLLITAEYLVLSGAKALAVPTAKGQRMSVTPRTQGGTEWTALDHLGNVRFQGCLGQGNSDLKFAEQLVQAALGHANHWPDAQIETVLEFAPEWGWGSSSSLTSLVAQWLQVDPMSLHESVSLGSGYDVACAQAPGPILYQKGHANQPVDLSQWPKEHIRFLYLGQKQDSQSEVAKFLDRQVDSSCIDQVNDLSEALVDANNATTLMRLIETHEALMSDVLSQPTIKSQRFSDSPLAFKSLGAWGGDFAMAVAEDPSEFGYLDKSNLISLSWSEVF